jgi:tetratricopeptide (TPR) repeat protein/predicted MPP superfamily phosphohydrolase
MDTLFTWLHLSDLHVRAASASGAREAFLACLREDLPTRGRERLDAIVVTGDVAFSGRADEYDVAGAFLLDAARGAGLGPERVFVVPGNHDVDRATDQAPVTAKLLAELRQGRRRLDAAIEAPRARAVITTRLHAFSAFAAAFGPEGPAEVALDELLWWSHAVEGRGGLRVRILGLSTVLLADGDADRGCLRLGEAQLREAQATVRERELVIALSHHPVRGGWLADERDAEAWLREHAHLHLTGHVHDPIAEEARAGAPGPFVWVATGAAPARRKIGLGSARRFGYALGSIVRGPDGALAARIAPRRWVPEEKRFVPDEKALPEGQTFADRALRLASAAPAPKTRTRSTTPPPKKPAAAEKVEKAATPEPASVRVRVPAPVRTPAPPPADERDATTPRVNATPQPGPVSVGAPARAAALEPRPGRVVRDPRRDPRREEPEPTDHDWISPTATAAERAAASTPPRRAPEITSGRSEPPVRREGPPPSRRSRPPAPSSPPVPETPPAPRAASTPAPRAASTPAPRAAATPAPSATATPAPRAAATAGWTLSPNAAATPAPNAAATAAPNATATPAPRAAATPGPGRAEPGPAALFEGPGALPATPVPYFVDRADDRIALRAALVDPVATCVVVTGLGGLGKTALVQQLVATDARAIFAESAWIDARDLAAELGRVAKRFGLRAAERAPTVDESVRFLRGVLESRRILLVIDNVNPGMADVRALPIPAAGSASRALLTSRIVTLHEDLGKLARPLRLAPWEPGTIRAHLREVAPALRSEPDAALDALGRGVGGLPLAVRLLGRQLLRPDVTVTSLRARLERDPLGALDAGARPGEASAASTFRPSVDGLGPSERRVLVALSACAPATRTAMVAEVAGVREDEAGMALEGLADQSLVEWLPDAERPFRLHPVIRAVLGAQPGAEDAVAAHDRMVRAHVEGHRDPNDWQALERDLPEVLAVTDRRLARGDVAGAWEPLRAVMGLLDRRGASGEIVAAANRVLQAAPPDGPLAAAILGDLGLLWCSLGDLTQAEGALGRALALAEEQGSAEAQARAVGGLARCAALRGELEKAVGLHRRSATLHELLGLRHLYANDLGNVGLLYRRMGNVGDAIEQLERALAIHEQLGVSEGRAEVLCGLGLCFRDIGEPEAGIEHFERALAIHEELGRRSGQATMLGNLGNTYRALGRHDRAIAHLGRALAIYEELGLLDGQGAALGNLGSCYRALGDTPRARDHFERALATLRRINLPDDHPHVKAMLAALAAPPKRS